MKTIPCIIASVLVTAAAAVAGVSIDDAAFGKSLGGWKKSGSHADYSLSGANYRTFKPETSPTPDGGLFVSVRIDHLRGWLASNDHAVLEITVGPKGGVISAQSTIAIQGRSISSDVIQGGNTAGKELVSPERAVQIGTDLVSDLTAKFLRENIVEAGRVSFPAALRHNYNQLFQAIRVEGIEVLAAVVIPNEPIVQPPAPEPAPPPADAAKPAADKPKEAATPADTPPPGPVPLEIKRY